MWSTEAQACLLDLREPMRFNLRLHGMFEFPQEPMRFVPACQASVELLFMFTDQYLYVNKS